MISQFFEKENEPEEMEIHKTTISTENELEKPVEESELKSSSIDKDSEEIKIHHTRLGGLVTLTTTVSEDSQNTPSTSDGINQDNITFNFCTPDQSESLVLKPDLKALNSVASEFNFSEPVIASPNVKNAVKQSQNITEQISPPDIETESDFPKTDGGDVEIPEVKEERITGNGSY